MGQLIRIFLLILLISGASLPSWSAVQGNIQYQIPIDYTKLNEAEILERAEFFYGMALKSSNGNVNEEMTAALNLYTILCKKCPDNVMYPTRLGILYDLCGMDKYAKGCFYKAMGIKKSRPEPYFYLGEFFYKRRQFKDALNMYKRAYKNGYSGNYETLYKIGAIYEKFGDTEAALRYFKKAAEISPNSELDNKIIRVENADKSNREYYSDTRIRLRER